MVDMFEMTKNLRAKHYNSVHKKELYPSWVLYKTVKGKYAVYNQNHHKWMVIVIGDRKDVGKVVYFNRESQRISGEPLYFLNVPEELTDEIEEILHAQRGDLAGKKFGF